jgi:aminoglycoside 6'-N-acetyltransferase I
MRIAEALDFVALAEYFGLMGLTGIAGLAAVGQMLIREIVVKDAAEWEAMRRDLWPDGDDHDVEIAAFFAGTLAEPETVLVAEDDGLLIGFAELSLRRDVAGLEGKLTGYVEGLFVRPAFRWRAVARRLLTASREWAGGRGCEVFASDRGGRMIVDRSFWMGLM